MSANRPLVSLKEAGVSLIDCDHKTPKAQDQGLPYIGIPQLKDGRIILEGARLISEEDFKHWRRKAKPTANDVLLSRRCNPGESAFVPDGLEIALGQNLVLLRSDGTKVHPAFLRWLTQGPQWWSQVNQYLNVGAVFDSLKCADIPKFEVYLPPIDEQKSIAKVLGDLDHKILLNDQINHTLEQMAQAIFKSWFVDFEPVKAKIAALEAGGSEEDALLAAMQAISGTSLFDADASAAGAQAALTRLQAEQPEQYAELRATAELFPSAMQDSELGEIPKGWGVNQIGDLVTRIPVGKKYSQKTASETGDVPVLDQGKSGIIGYHNEKPGVTACPDDPVIVFANHTCYMRLIMHDFSAIQNVLPFKSKPAKALNIFWLYFATHGKQEFIEYKGHWPDFVIKEIVVPDDSIASRFGSIAKDLVVNQFRNEKQNETLSAIRDAMLPKLLSGELSVTDVANQTEGAEGAVNV